MGRWFREITKWYQTCLPGHVGAIGVELVTTERSKNPMKQRIALWTLAGFIVACAWVLFIAAMGPDTRLRLESGRLFWAIADVTAPASLLRHLPVKDYWFVLLNALIYGLAGFAMELLRRTPQHRLSS
jgi:hypothetical protein